MIYKNNTSRTVRLAGIGKIDPGGEIVWEKAINSTLLTEIKEIKEIKETKKQDIKKETEEDTEEKNDLETNETSKE